MPDLSKVLKDEIARIARKQLRSEMHTLKSTVAQQRHAIAAIKKQLEAVQRQAKRADKALTRQRPTPQADEPEGKQLRFSAGRLAAHRAKLELSAEQYAKLVGVSALSIYKWEKGQTRPRRAQLEALASVRTLGKREAQARLAA